MSLLKPDSKETLAIASLVSDAKEASASFVPDGAFASANSNGKEQNRDIVVLVTMHWNAFPSYKTTDFAFSISFETLQKGTIQDLLDEFRKHVLKQFEISLPSRLTAMAHGSDYMAVSSSMSLERWFCKQQNQSKIDTIMIQICDYDIVRQQILRNMSH